MQLLMNIKMKSMLEGRAEVSILHKSQTYDWNPKNLDELLENDPNPDADVRFFCKEKEKPPIVSQFSHLRRKFDKKHEDGPPVKLVLVGTYQHICISLVFEKEKVRGHSRILSLCFSC